MAFATFLVWWLRTGACGVGARGFWRYRMPSSQNMPASPNTRAITIIFLRRKLQEVETPTFLG